MKIVRVSWMNPARTLDEHPEALEGIQIQQTINRPADQYLFVANEDADKLKAQIEARVPRSSYTVHDDTNRPVIQDGQAFLVTEPEVEIIDVP